MRPNTNQRQKMVPTLYVPIEQIRANNELFRARMSLISNNLQQLSVRDATDMSNPIGLDPSVQLLPSSITQNPMMTMQDEIDDIITTLQQDDPLQWQNALSTRVPQLINQLRPVAQNSNNLPILKDRMTPLTDTLNRITANSNASQALRSLAGTSLNQINRMIPLSFSNAQPTQTPLPPAGLGSSSVVPASVEDPDLPQQKPRYEQQQQPPPQIQRPTQVPALGSQSTQQDQDDYLEVMRLKKRIDSMFGKPINDEFDRQMRELGLDLGKYEHKKATRDAYLEIQPFLHLAHIDAEIRRVQENPHKYTPNQIEHTIRWFQGEMNNVAEKYTKLGSPIPIENPKGYIESTIFSLVDLIERKREQLQKEQANQGRPVSISPQPVPQQEPQPMIPENLPSVSLPPRPQPPELMDNTPAPTPAPVSTNASDSDEDSIKETFDNMIAIKDKVNVIYDKYKKDLEDKSATTETRDKALRIASDIRKFIDDNHAQMTEAHKQNIIDKDKYEDTYTALSELETKLKDIAYKMPNRSLLGKVGRMVVGGPHVDLDAEVKSATDTDLQNKFNTALSSVVQNLPQISAGAVVIGYGMLHAKGMASGHFIPTGPAGASSLAMVSAPVVHDAIATATYSAVATLSDPQMIEATSKSLASSALTLVKGFASDSTALLANNAPSFAPLVASASNTLVSSSVKNAAQIEAVANQVANKYTEKLGELLVNQTANLTGAIETMKNNWLSSIAEQLKQYLIKFLSSLGWGAILLTGALLIIIGYGVVKFVKKLFEAEKISAAKINQQFSQIETLIKENAKKATTPQDKTVYNITVNVYNNLPPRQVGTRLETSIDKAEADVASVLEQAVKQLRKTESQAPLDVRRSISVAMENSDAADMAGPPPPPDAQPEVKADAESDPIHPDIEHGVAPFVEHDTGDRKLVLSDKQINEIVNTIARSLKVEQKKKLEDALKNPNITYYIIGVDDTEYMTHFQTRFTAINKFITKGKDVSKAREAMYNMIVHELVMPIGNIRQNHEEVANFQKLVGTDIEPTIGHLPPKFTKPPTAAAAAADAQPTAQEAQPTEAQVEEETDGFTEDGLEAIADKLSKGNLALKETIMNKLEDNKTIFLPYDANPSELTDYVGIGKATQSRVEEPLKYVISYCKGFKKFNDIEKARQYIIDMLIGKPAVFPLLNNSPDEKIKTNFARILGYDLNAEKKVVGAGKSSKITKHHFTDKNKNFSDEHAIQFLLSA